MATKKAGGTSKNGRDSISKSFGLKVNSLQKVKKNSVLIFGNKLAKISSGIGSVRGKNRNLMSCRKGFVKFYPVKKLNKKFLLVL